MVPEMDQLGATATYTVGTDTGERNLRARFIGYGSSQDGTKSRWIEIRIYDVPEHEAYVIDYIGRTTLAGEVDHHWHVLAPDDDALIDRLASGRSRSTADQASGPKFFSGPAQQAIKSAIRYVPDLSAAYEEHPAYTPTLPALS